MLKTWRLMAMVGLAATTMAVSLAATPAQAAPYDGSLASAIPGCMANNKRISADDGTDGSISMYREDGTYLGWAEWRSGTGGGCAGYQWVRLHPTRTTYAYAQAELYERVFWSNGQLRGQSKISGLYPYPPIHWTKLEAGTVYDGTAIYTPNDLMCADMLMWYPPSGGPNDSSTAIFYGRSGYPARWCA